MGAPTPRYRKRQATRWRKAQWDLGVRHCCYCGVHMAWKIGHPHSCTTEHRQPLALGGADDVSNWALSCYQCNDAKGALTEEEFLAVRGGTAFPVPWS